MTTLNKYWRCAINGHAAMNQVFKVVLVLGSLSLSGLAGFGGMAVAQTVPQTVPPDAGSLLQRLERDRLPALPRLQAPQAPVPPPMQAQPGVVVTAQAFQFAGNTLLSAEQLAPAVAPFLNRPLDFAQLQAAAAAVAAAYREAGWVVRAYLPKQEITDGIVTIQIVEAVFGKAILEGDAPLRLKFDVAQSIVGAQQTPGQPLNANAVDRALLLIDDLPGVSTVGSLVEGTHDGETDLVFKFANEPLLMGDAMLDNTGSRATGDQRLAANLTLNSALGLGDLISANLVHTKGSDYARLAASVPVGFDGWRIGVNASHMAYRLIAPEFLALNASGKSVSTGFDANYPLIRTRLKNLYLALAYERKDFDNQANGGTTSDYRTNAFTLGLNGNTFDSLGGGGANSASLALSRGHLNLDDSPNRATDASGPQAAGDYAKLRYSLSRQQVITKDLSLFAALSDQIASKNLDSSEKFTLGGATGVRAYPSGEASGAEGKMFNLELRYKLPQNLTLTGFYDWGQVSVNRNNHFTGAAALNTYSLQGAGLALAWQSSAGLNLKATLARRIGNNPNPTATGNDQDGSLTKNRFWLTSSLPF